MFSRKRPKSAPSGQVSDPMPVVDAAAVGEAAYPVGHDAHAASDDVYFPSSHEMLIGDGIELTGDIRNCARFIIAGSFTGTLHASEVLVLSKASLNAVIVADRVDVFGQVAGEIVAADNVRFRDGSLFDGRLVYRRMLVDPGALLSGELSQFATEDEQAALDQLDAFSRTRDDTISLTGEAAVELAEPEAPARSARAGR